MFYFNKPLVDLPPPPPPPKGLFISSMLDVDFIERESEREAYLRGGGLIEDLRYLSPIKWFSLF